MNFSLCVENGPPLKGEIRQNYPRTECELEKANICLYGCKEHHPALVQGKWDMHDRMQGMCVEKG